MRARILFPLIATLVVNAACGARPSDSAAEAKSSSGYSCAVKLNTFDGSPVPQMDQPKTYDFSAGPGEKKTDVVRFHRPTMCCMSEFRYAIDGDGRFDLELGNGSAYDSPFTPDDPAAVLSVAGTAAGHIRDWVYDASADCKAL